MARNNQNVSYTPDAFDEPPEGPVGVHRGNPAWYAVILPYFITILIAVAAGLLVWALGSGEISHISSIFNHNNQSSQSAKAPSKSADKKPKKTDKKDADDSDNSDASDDSNKESESKKDNSSDKSADKNNNNSDNNANQQAVVDKTVAVKVINATNIAGHAAKNAAVLKQAGYTNVTAGNPTGKVPSDSVVWYKDESQKAAAEDIAKTLGISAVESANEIVSQIVVVLCK